MSQCSSVRSVCSASSIAAMVTFKPPCGGMASSSAIISRMVWRASHCWRGVIAFVCAVSPCRPTILRRIFPMRDCGWLVTPTKCSCACGKRARHALASVCFSFDPFSNCSEISLAALASGCHPYRVIAGLAFYNHNKLRVVTLSIWVNMHSAIDLKLMASVQVGGVVGCDLRPLP